MTPEFRTTHKRLAGGRKKVYYYSEAGTRFWTNMDFQMAPPFPEAFLRAYQAALDEEREARSTRPEGDIAGYILEYLASDKFSRLAEQTRLAYRRDLDLARIKFGSAPRPVSAEDYLAFRADIVSWHDELARSSPRRADHILTVFRNALDHATRRGKLLHNPAADLETSYERPDDKRPWSPQDIAAFLQGDPEKKIEPVTQDVSDIFHVGLYTGLRRTDVVALTWSAIGRQEIEWQTSKSRGRRTVIIPLVEEATTFFADLRRRQSEAARKRQDGVQEIGLVLPTTVITGARGLPLAPSAIQKKVNERAKALGLDVTFHRLRNTYATLLVKAGIRPEEIAGIMGWTIADVHELIRIYVHRDVIVAAQVRKLREAGKS